MHQTPVAERFRAAASADGTAAGEIRKGVWPRSRVDGRRRHSARPDAAPCGPFRGAEAGAGARQSDRSSAGRSAGPSGCDDLGISGRHSPGALAGLGGALLHGLSSQALCDRLPSSAVRTNPGQESEARRDGLRGSGDDGSAGRRGASSDAGGENRPGVPGAGPNAAGHAGDEDHRARTAAFPGAPEPPYEASANLGRRNAPVDEACLNPVAVSVRTAVFANRAGAAAERRTARMGCPHVVQNGLPACRRERRQTRSLRRRGARRIAASACRFPRANPEISPPGSCRQIPATQSRGHRPEQRPGGSFFPPASPFIMAISAGSTHGAYGGNGSTPSRSACERIAPPLPCLPEISRRERILYTPSP